MRRKPYYLIASVLILCLASLFVWQRQSSKPKSVEDIFPGKVWSKPIAQLPDLKGVGAPRAENCGKCHGEIYKEWKTSTHAHALSDLQFQAELSKLTSPKWICLNCHIPVQNQRETIINQLTNGDYNRPIEIVNPGFDSVMQAEAVTCATCHVRLDEDGNSYVLGANGKTNPPHPVKINQDALRNRCLDCHNETYNLSSSLVCYFQTGNEMKEARQHFPGKDCASCHLPSIARSFVNANLKKPIRNSHKHAFIGGGVPKEFSLYPSQVPSGYKPGVEVRAWKLLEGGKISVNYQNANAGHYVPSGDPERFLRLELEFLDKENKVLEKRQEIIGQTWKWDPKAELVSENRLRPKEIRSWMEVIPRDNVESVLFRIVHVKLKDTNASYMSSHAEGVDPIYREKIVQLKEYYPQSSIVLESRFYLASKKVTETPLADLFERNANRRGE